MRAAPETVGRLLYCRHLAAGEIGLMKYRDLRDFIQQLEKLGELKRVTREVDPRLEMTEICDRTLKAGGPAILFENPKGSSIPVLGNLFGTERRVALGMGRESVEELRELGELLAPREVEALNERARAMVDRPVFPTLDPYHNVPWPWV